MACFLSLSYPLVLVQPGFIQEGQEFTLQYE